MRKNACTVVQFFEELRHSLKISTVKMQRCMKNNEHLSDEKQEKILQLHTSNLLQEKIGQAEHYRSLRP